MRKAIAALLCVLSISMVQAADSAPEDLGLLVPVKRPELSATTLRSMGQMLNMPTVSEELKISDEQRTQIRALDAKSRAVYQKLSQIIQNVQVPADRQAAIQQLSVESTDVYKELPTLLTTSQMDRAFELYLQKLKLEAVLLPELTDVLKLTDEQLTKLKELQLKKAAALKESVRAILTLGLNAAARNEKVKEEMEKVEAKLVEEQTKILTKPQQTSLQRLQGKKFDGFEQTSTRATTSRTFNAVPVQQALPAQKLVPAKEAPKQ